MKKACKYCVFYEDGKCEDSKGPDYCCDEFLLDEALFQGGESNSNEIKDEIQNEIQDEEEDQNEVVEKGNDENSTDMEVTLQSSTLEKRLEELDEKLKEINVDKKGKKIIITIDLSSLFE